MQLTRSIFLSIAGFGFCSATDLKTLLTNSANNWSPNLTISFPGSSAFTNATDRWTVFDEPTFIASVTVGNEADVVKLVKLATTNGIAFLATGGRHGYTTTLGRMQNGLSIDLSQLDSYSIDKKAGTLTVGGGVVVESIVGPAYEAGFELQTGSSSCPGLVGVTLGGGVGRYSGIYGLMVDNLQSVRLVTATGQVLTVSATSNPDLFWAIRGAGANFGIVTQATYKLNHIIPGVNGGGGIVNLDMVFPANKSAAYFNVIESLAGGPGCSLPAKLGLISLAIYDSASGGPQLLANWVYMGTQAEAEKVAAPVLALNPTSAVFSNLTYGNILTEGAFGVDAELCAKGSILDIYTSTVRNISASSMQAAFEEMGALYAAYPDAQSSIINFENFANQDMLAKDDGSTVYPWRDATGNYIISMSWSEGADAATQAAADTTAQNIRRLLSATSGYPGNGTVTLVSYAHGDEGVASIYGARNMPRLAALKKKYDPSNVFRFNNALPTSWP
ncbi:putative fad-binding domain-containing protein [Phaeoacremonium minimum UCRPA7]|uniref:Putative fad-binding domain-containing protein n=1 Tax=Phaeoacremonium minimum (strain UCR-PA7) TaxID=1286976 RepID=R8B8J6_PHAM7|nr:putative fad-binding domain-containing protein [Phaeoacremonium minimum UCRPA7]EON95592.1 putative fad-binding domain-containing protein [Phaeoacremonium minimum UCRPA7]